MNGRAVRWDPIPRNANQYMLLQVVRFAEMPSLQGRSVEVDVTFFDETPDADLLTWHITFESVAAFGMHPMQSGRTHQDTVVFPTHGNRGEVYPLQAAAWEVVNSVWLAENTPSGFPLPQSLHHYVLADVDDVYEIAAVAWSTEQLGVTSQRERDTKEQGSGENRGTLPGNGRPSRLAINRVK